MIGIIGAMQEEKVGFKEIEVISDFNEYNEECERNIFVCKKG